jgi:LCP family protein required for cell wall assembly
MPTDAKPYRRYRARGGARDGGDGLAELHALVERTAPGAPARPSARPRPAPARRPPERRPAPAAPGRRRPWSVRGLSPWGWARRVALLLLIGLIAWAGVGYWTLSSAVGESNARVTAAARRALDPAPGGLLGTPQNTLIIGSDGRIGETRSRADTIMVMRTDPDAGRIKYLSIPRDFMVQLPDLGTAKINAAFFTRGQAGIIRAVRDLTDLPIHHLIVVNFRGLPRLVDELGGVTVSNPTAIIDCPYPGGRTVSFPRGRIELDGRRALEFARVRKCDDDVARAARQQALLAALKGEIASPASLPRAPWRGAAVARAITTDLGTLDMIKMGWLQARLDQRPDDRIVLAGEPSTIGGISYVVPLPDEDERQLQRFVSRS